MNNQSANVLAVCISEKKGTAKKSVPKIYVKKDYGIEGDAHAGGGHRQVSLLAEESVNKLCAKIPDIEAGVFAENMLTRGIKLHALPVGARLRVGEALLEITQIGKECHNDGCAIKQQIGDCVMPREGVFAKVIESGFIQPGDNIKE